MFGYVQKFRICSMIKTTIVVHILKTNLLTLVNFKLETELKIEKPEINIVITVAILFHIVLKFRILLSKSQYKNAKLIIKVKPSVNF